MIGNFLGRLSRRGVFDGLRRWKKSTYLVQLMFHLMSFRSRALVLAGLIVVYFLAYGPGYDSVGILAGVFSTVPVIAAAWLFGVRAGVIAGLATFPVNLLLLQLVTGAEQVDVLRPSSVLGSATEALVGYVVGLTRDMKARAEKQATDLERSREALRSLQLRMLDLQEEERRNLARELHDEFGQELTGLKFALDQEATQSDLPGKRNAKRQVEIVDRLLSRVRDLSLRLRPSTLDDFGLVPAVEGLVDYHAGNGSLRVDFEHSGLDDRLAPQVENTVYRVVQEGLTNVSRHAQTDKVNVALALRNGLLRVVIEDQGVGFDAGMVMSGAGSVGLPAMRERVEGLGGTLTIDSVLGEGTMVRAELPARKLPRSAE